MKVMKNWAYPALHLLIWAVTVYGTGSSTAASAQGDNEHQDQTFLFDCDSLRRMKQLPDAELDLLCGQSKTDDSSLGDGSLSNQINSNGKTISYGNDGLSQWNPLDTVTRKPDYVDKPVAEWPAFENWGTKTKSPYKYVTMDWKEIEDLQNLFTVKPIDLNLPSVNPYADIDWNGNGSSKTSSSTFGITGVVIGLGALVVLSVMLSLGIVYCCRMNQQRRIRRQRLFLITARADEDYDQFRHDMETTPPCVGVRVECPPSYEDALHHSTTPPMVLIDDLDTQPGFPSPPSYNAVIDSSPALSPNYTYSSSGDVRSYDIPTDVSELQSPSDDIAHPFFTTTSQLVLKDDRDYKDDQ